MTPNSEIRYSDHYEYGRIAHLIPEGFGEAILQNPDAYHYDTLRQRFVAVRRMFVLGADRDVAVAYEIHGNITWLVTVFILKERQQWNRRGTGRWVPYEPESEL